MSDDRELLELAARAADYKIYDHPIGKKSDAGFIFTVGRKPWNPLADDGDALRLAAKLQIDIESGAAYAQATWYDLDLSETHEVLEYFDYEEERLPTIRLCVVRAAAKIGSTKPD